MTENLLSIIHLLIIPIQVTLCVAALLLAHGAEYWLWYAIVLPNIFLLWVRVGYGHLTDSLYIKRDDYGGHLRIVVFSGFVFFAVMALFELVLPVPAWEIGNVSFEAFMLASFAMGRTVEVLSEQ